LVHNKGYDLLATALAEVAADVGRIEWSHFGDGAEAGRVREIVRRSPGVTWDHHTDASDEVVQSALAGCRLFVQPSRYEGSSLTVLEAMAQAAVVVATPVGGIPDKISDGYDGYLAQAPTAAAIAAAVRRALSSEVAPAVRRRARETVLTRFDLAAQTRSYVRLFDQAGHHG
jgi:glycosyltransferase involved in cell wall biosynthesis